MHIYQCKNSWFARVKIVPIIKSLMELQNLGSYTVPVLIPLHKYDFYISSAFNMIIVPPKK